MKSGQWISGGLAGFAPRVRFGLAVVLWLTAHPGVAGLTLMPAWFSGQREIALPFAASDILPGPGGTVIVLSRDAQAAALVNLSDGHLLALEKFDGVPVAAAAREGAPTEMRILSRMDDGSYRFDTITLDQDGQNSRVSLGLPVEVTAMRDPALAYAIFGENPKGEQSKLVIWDSDPKTDVRYFLMVRPRGLEVVPAKDLPGQFLPVATGRFMLGLHPASNLISIIDLIDGSLVDLVALDGLSYAESGDLSVFAPGASRGGTGAAVVANGDNGLLTVLSVRAGPRPRIDLPLQLSLAGRRSSIKGTWQLRVAADADMQFILAGTVGSPTVQIIRRIKGGLELSDHFDLSGPLVGLTAVTGPEAGDANVFVFLGAGGRSLLASDIPAIEARLTSVTTYAVPRKTMPVRRPDLGRLSTLGNDEVIRLQRSLAGLGFKVGAIDGAAGGLTASALRSFQLDHKIEPSDEVDSATWQALQAALAAGSSPAPKSEVALAFDAYLDAALGQDFDGARLMVLGPTQQDPDQPCFGLNDYAPETLWPNAVKFAHVLALLEATSGLKVTVTSGYQTEALSRCLGSQGHKLHSNFQAFDVEIAALDGGADPTPGKLAELVQALRDLEDQGLATLELRLEGTVLHVAPMVGAYRVVISSDKVSAKTCDAVKQDVDEFGRLLAGGLLAEREIYVARTEGRDVYAVIVDFNNDESAALAAVDVIRTLSAKTVSGKTGMDAFIQNRNGLFIDPGCTRMLVIPTTSQKKKS